MAELVQVDRVEEGIVVLTIDRAEKRNALSIQVRDEVSDALDQLADDEATKVVVVTGAGEIFSAGFDLKEFEQPERAEELWASSDRFHARVLSFPLPTIAAVNGPALAGGFDLAVMCDLRVASATARFAHPEATFAEVVYAPLHDLVGGAVARDLALTGRAIDAEEALRLHLVSAVVPPEEVMALALERAREIARAPRSILLKTKAKIIRRASIALGATLDL
jgi:enoyl-CoA hydratase